MAGYKGVGNSAEASASEILRNPKVAEAIQKGKESRRERSYITAERVLLELSRIAFFDPRKLLDDAGHPKPLDELDDDTAAAVAGLDLLEEYRGEGKDRTFVGYVKKFKIADKNTALTNAMRHLGILTDKVDLTSKGEQIQSSGVLKVPGTLSESEWEAQSK